MNEHLYSHLISQASEFCLAQGPRLRMCTEVPNHSGDHVAELHGEVIDRWPQEDLVELQHAEDWWRGGADSSA